MKVTIHVLLLQVLFLLIFSSLQAQSDYKALEDQLKGLTNQAYVRKALSIGEEKAKQNDTNAALYFMDLAIKKGSKISSSVEATLFLSKADILIAYGNQSDPVMREILSALKSCNEADKKRILADEIVATARGLNRLLADPVMIGALHSFIANIDPSALDEFKNNTLAAKQKERIESQLKQSVAEKQTLQEEQKQIKLTVRSLNKSKLMLDEQLNVKNQEVQNLTAQSALQLAELERSKRVMDSLSFMATLDSMALLQQDFLYEKQREKLVLESAKARSMRIAVIAMIAGTLLLIWLYFLSRSYNTKLKEKNGEIEQEKNKYQELLLNILPPTIAEELKVNGKVKAKYHESATILFADLVNFSTISKTIPSEQLVRDLDYCFAAFDRIISRHNVEKIKTIGDAYMCIGGLPHQTPNSELNVIKAAIEIQDFLKLWNVTRRQQKLPEFNARIGIHTGPVVAGVVGEKKFAYDVWGDSVNIASRMESNSAAGMINVSDSTYEIVKSHFQFIKRGQIKTKNMNDMEMYFVQVA